MVKSVAPGSRGFSLIELMIVLVIMGFMLAFAGPRVAKGLRGLSLKTTVKKVSGALRYARSRAVNTGRLYYAVFDAEKNRVIIVPSLDPAGFNMGEHDNATDEEAYQEEDGAKAAFGKGAAPEIKIYPLPDGITFEKITIGEMSDEDEEGDEIYQMTFFPNGTSQGCEVILTDTKERMFLIAVNFMTGVVSFEDQTDE